jgi:hypothetical protein
VPSQVVVFLLLLFLIYQEPFGVIFFFFFFFFFFFLFFSLYLLTHIRLLPFIYLAARRVIFPLTFFRERARKKGNSARTGRPLESGTRQRRQGGSSYCSSVSPNSVTTPEKMLYHTRM